MRTIAIILLALLLVGCGPKPKPAPLVPETTSRTPADDTTLEPLAAAPPPAPGQPVSFGRDVLPLLASACASCHGPENPGGGYAVNSHCDVTGPGSDSAPNVVPGQPDRSLLYTWMAQGHPPCAPPDSNALRVVRDWILQGAKNN